MKIPFVSWMQRAITIQYIAWECIKMIDDDGTAIRRMMSLRLGMKSHLDKFEKLYQDRENGNA
jgi:hypothetical protein